LALALLCGIAGPAYAADPVTESPGGATPILSIERSGNELYLSAQFAFELPAVVVDALGKGIPIYFVAQADLLRERWYWRDLAVASVQRRLRLSYHPLTRRWRLSVGAPGSTETGQGLALSQNFDSLEGAMAAVRRISHWEIADAANIEHGAQYLIEFKFELDTTELPRLLQIGTLGQSDWAISLTASKKLTPELSK